ncbi:prepilin-type N-terminal cleavage/methylation domain-containing protein [Clostridium sp.]|uniref:prepilin-type N-terminal cleavage/methylation domain-containing protein n=1 Tax=Clostridium sp. TaxID=1506 RepID=UPI0026DD28D9|nr:prepilin-type N-terminal cleavage/methylation domain-containing protein [Clostridium sp.]MDO5039010.1 prepilin-type N-terminal cleavage/methylation domain-containing protein [Clostridium sp.]
MIKKKKGYTLIELMAVIIIITIIIGSSNSIINYYTKAIRNLETENFLTSIEGILTYSKAKAIKENKNFQINFSKANSKVNLTQEGIVIESFKIPDYISVENGSIIQISTNGQISSQTTVMKNYKDKEKYSLKIRVGVDYINIEKEKW